MFKGAITAMITPFENGKIDEKNLENLIEYQIKEKIDGLVSCGTTGESPTLDHDEHNRVVEIFVAVSAKRVPIMAGAGSNCTKESIMLAQHAQKVGADAILVATPYYNKPNQEGIFRHFEAINNEIDLPIYIYNIPARSVVDINDETIFRISELKNIAGIKDATGNIARCSSLRCYNLKKDFIQLSGEDGTALAFNAQGGKGVISVTSNVAPGLVVKCQKLFFDNKFDEALKLHDKLTALHQIMFCDTNPSPAKYALSLMNKCRNELRLPLLPLDKTKELQVRKILENLEII